MRDAAAAAAAFDASLSPPVARCTRGAHTVHAQQEMRAKEKTVREERGEERQLVPMRATLPLNSRDPHAIGLLSASLPRTAIADRRFKAARPGKGGRASRCPLLAISQVSSIRPRERPELVFIPMDIICTSARTRWCMNNYTHAHVGRSHNIHSFATVTNAEYR